MTIEEKLNSIRQTKEAIKTSIQNKGVEVLDTDTFASYAEKIDSIESGGGDISEYFTETIVSGGDATSHYYWSETIKKLPAFTNLGSLKNLFRGFRGTEIDVSKLDFSKSTTINSMFSACSNLTDLDFSKCDTSNMNNINNMGSVFYRCSSLTNLDLSNFDVSNVSSFNYMFEECSNLKFLDLSSWNTHVECSAISLFLRANSLSFIDMRNFDFTKITSYTNMFGTEASTGPVNNCLIIVKDETAKTWITEKFTRLTNVKTVAEYEAQ